MFTFNKVAVFGDGCGFSEFLFPLVFLWPTQHESRYFTAMNIGIDEQKLPLLNEQFPVASNSHWNTFWLHQVYRQRTSVLRMCGDGSRCSTKLNIEFYSNLGMATQMKL